MFSCWIFLFPPFIRLQPKYVLRSDESVQIHHFSYYYFMSNRVFLVPFQALNYNFILGIGIGIARATPWLYEIQKPWKVVALMKWPLITVINVIFHFFFITSFRHHNHWKCWKSMTMVFWYKRKEVSDGHFAMYTKNISIFAKLCYCVIWIQLSNSIPSRIHWLAGRLMFRCVIDAEILNSWWVRKSVNHFKTGGHLQYG